MEKTWRWFGLNDKITLDMLRQIGVEGIVTSLHNIPNGEIWRYEDIMELKKFIESHGLHWSVVESLPVSESIKYGGDDRDNLIEKYKISLANLGKAGIRTICYNFMPVLDWARTDLEYPNGDGTSTLYFNRTKFAYFDMYILGRKGADKDYDKETLKQVEYLRLKMTKKSNQQLIENIIIKTQGFVNGNISEDDKVPVETFNKLLKLYDGINRDMLRNNMKYFLDAIMPICQEYGIQMCVHPDDPPLQILGLPRIVTDDADIEWLFNAVPDVHNGLTFCAGSLSANPRNDIQQLAEKYAKRTFFVHARICEVLPNGDFKESSHLDRRLINVIKTFERQCPNVPMRVDHAPLMLGDEKMRYNAGYSFHGRMLALGMISGIMATINNFKNK